MDTKCLSIIPARGGSKRIPGKNIRLFCGKPIINYSIDTAFKTELFEEIMVSTDDPAIAKIAEENNASVPFIRSPQNSNDSAVLTEVLKEVLNKYKERGKSFEYCCCIYATAPLINKQNVIEAFELIKNGSFSAVIAVARSSYSAQRSFQLIDKKLSWLMPEFENTRSQDLNETYYDAAQFFWFRIDHFMETGKIVGPDTAGYELDSFQVQDIDTEKDWEIAEFKFEYLRSRL